MKVYCDDAVFVFPVIIVLKAFVEQFPLPPPTNEWFVVALLSNPPTTIEQFPDPVLNLPPPIKVAVPVAMFLQPPTKILYKPELVFPNPPATTL